MTHKKWKHQKHLRLCAAVGLLALSVGMPMWSIREGLIPQFVDEVRELKTQRLFFARALDILKDNQRVISTLSDTPINVESLTLSLIESTKQQALNNDIEILLLSVTDLNTTQTPSDLNTNSPNLLRVEFTGILQRATDLLLLFDGVREIADWRPMEVRGCSVNRRSDIAGLHTECAIDVYYFPELDA